MFSIRTGGQEGLSDLTQLAIERAQGLVLPAPLTTSQDRTGAGQTHCSPFSVTDDFTHLSLRERAQSVQSYHWVLHRCTQQFSPFNSHFTSFQATRKEQPGSEAAISQCTAPQFSEIQLPALLVFPYSVFQALAKRALFSAIH